MTAVGVIVGLFVAGVLAVLMAALKLGSDADDREGRP